MKPYPAYKDRGTEWIGKIPEHWELTKLKRLAKVRLSNIDKKSIDGEIPVRLCNYIDVYYNEKITSKVAFMVATAPEEKIKDFSLRAGDVLITKDSESPDDIAVPGYVSQSLPGIVCGYHLALIRPSDGYYDGNYLSRSFVSNGIRDQFEISANGITRFGIGKYSIDNSLFLTPPIDEQRKIAKYLDYKIHLIDTLIEKKQRQIELLHEQRTAIISHAVTKGLNPNVKMKDSGIEWLGEVPEHWMLSSLKLYWNVIDCKHRTANYVDDGIPIVSTTEIKPGRLNLDNTRKTTKGEYMDLIEGGRQPKKGDIIYSRNASVGSAAYCDNEETFCMGQDVCLITSSNENQLFLNYQLNSHFVTQQLESMLVGATFKRINVAQIKNYLILKPPRKEQNKIAKYLDEKTQTTDELIKTVESSIDSLMEYRTTLISEVVTGKIDVRDEAIP